MDPATTTDTDPSVADARQRYFDANGFSEAAYADRWVTIPLGRLNVRLPSTAGRRRAIPLHDLHHVATGYDTSLIGEAEIGAWELAAGCHDHHAAWIYNGMAVATGLVLAPRRVLAAWRRGRRSSTLYRGEYSPALLQLRLSELRARLGV
jgi:hypothetical protein